MALSTAGRELTEQHRRRQIALRALTVRQLLELWPAFDPTDVDRSWRILGPALATLVDARHRDSSALATAYYTAFRTAEGVPGSAAPRPAAPVDRNRLSVALRVTGPVGYSTALRYAPPQEAARTTLVKVTGAVTRLTLDGGRQALLRSVQHDRRAVGWRRVTSASPCSFCSMLASRGAVYGEASVDFQAHDHCACTGEPVWR